MKPINRNVAFNFYYLKWDKKLAFLPVLQKRWQNHNIMSQQQDTKMLFIQRMADGAMAYIQGKGSCSLGELCKNAGNLQSSCPSVPLQNGACSPSDVRKINTFTIMRSSTIQTAEVIAAEKTAVIFIFCLLHFVLILVFLFFYILQEQQCFTPQPPSICYFFMQQNFFFYVFLNASIVFAKTKSKTKLH